ncbi:hypothetical protein ACFXJ8_37055 [Nonomuraea sp. NPDC059194]|uniref:hypothetical protein n=1 Tax=Nonomuraea sp. NPDC059194 TaxID=3346764 RepID=UPI0036CDDC5D
MRFACLVMMHAFFLDMAAAPYEERSCLVPEGMGPYVALAEEWCERMIANSPRWSADRWRRIAAIHGIELVEEAAPATATRRRENDKREEAA